MKKYQIIQTVEDSQTSQFVLLKSGMLAKESMQITHCQSMIKS